MPIYDFACKNTECTELDIELETLSRVGAIEPCEKCGKDMKKLIKRPKGKRAPHISWSTWQVGLSGNS